MNPKGTDGRLDGSSEFPSSPVMRLFAGAPRPSGLAVLKTLPVGWKAKLIQVEPSYELDYGQAITASLFFDLAGLDPAGFISDDGVGSADAFERFSTLVPMLTRWMSGIPEARPVGSGGKLLIGGLARCSVKYVVGAGAAAIGGLFTATMTRGKDRSTLLAADLLEWRRGLPAASGPKERPRA